MYNFLLLYGRMLELVCLDEITTDYVERVLVNELLFFCRG